MSTLNVPGATLHHEVQGTGPVLLMICGGIFDADAYLPLAARLADRFTVVRYDRRGNSRSPLADPGEPQTIALHADDAHRILAAVTDEPAYVFGVSSGALIGMELAARHPGRVSALVAHEPPAFGLLPDAADFRAGFAEVEAVYREAGAGAAMGRFGELMGMSDEGQDGGQEAPGGEPDPAFLEAMARMERNMDFFIGHEAVPFSRQDPDLDALKGVRVVPTVGADSAGEPPHRAGLAVAERLGVAAVTLPGGHGGFGEHPAEYAAHLIEIFAD
ncbi:alpha/beta hydrolase [Actinomadura kijaniata]|uniref:Pimeloyl-ACP methyl ester carboxylesterase n=1 Tax=Actinomadura namibiensis TaxID=182080 RepID=A0A7W3LMW2_ACTNM|nr:alpha/beta hydrolase [Actinomadura namibiensis]MBA8951054.1 pimeloyl-ACP methyl ester carboxylesterase [Actinomadura namibiensis]